ncbi:MAG: sugar ABC transporter ATP-binding protein, partial [Treponema sp.]|nr:sugar ABC transporter ATP-binding protein [Treponema sp.]
MAEYRLRMENISKSFASMKALDNVELLVKKGEVHALLGMNGAGKSTLVKILSGIYTRDSGRIFIDDQEAFIYNAQDAMNCGVATVYQHPNLVNTFTGYENIYLGEESKSFTINREKMKKDAQNLAKEYKVNVDVTKMIGDMKPVERELICILNALSRESKILILDEPTSILTEKEKDILFEVVRELKAKDVSVIFVTHRLDEINEICDKITVFRDGKNVESSQVGKGIDSSYIAELMLGRSLEKFYPSKSTEDPGEIVFETQNLALNRRFENISLKAKKNEIFGIFGLVGSGIDELSKVIFGVVQPSQGKIFIRGKEIKIKSPQTAIKNKIFLIPSDRQTEGFVGDQGIDSNITMPKMDKITYRIFGLINEGVKRKHSAKLVKDLSIATPHVKKVVAELSGGNQQKVVVAKGLYTDADVYIFSEPTIGVDVGAKYSIYEIMRRLSKTSAVILISSDIEEVYGMADKVMVLN